MRWVHLHAPSISSCWLTSQKVGPPLIWTVVFLRTTAVKTFFHWPPFSLLAIKKEVTWTCRNLEEETEAGVDMPELWHTCSATCCPLLIAAEWLHMCSGAHSPALRCSASPAVVGVWMISAPGHQAITTHTYTKLCLCVTVHCTAALSKCRAAVQTTPALFSLSHYLITFPELFCLFFRFHDFNWESVLIGALANFT